MRFHTYTKFSPELADAIDLQALLDNLADFLLQSGFAGRPDDRSYFDSGLEGEGDRNAPRSSSRDIGYALHAGSRPESPAGR